MDPVEYQIKSRRTETDQQESLERINRIGIQSVRLLHAAVGLSGDVGEFCGAVERYVYYKQDLDRLNVIEEMGDCLWYIALACDALGVGMDNVMATNLAKLKERFPDEFDHDRSREENRDRAEEARALQDTKEIPERESEVPSVWELYQDQTCPHCRNPVSDEAIKRIHNGVYEKFRCPQCTRDFTIRCRQLQDGTTVAIETEPYYSPGG